MNKLRKNPNNKYKERTIGDELNDSSIDKEMFQYEDMEFTNKIKVEIPPKSKFPKVVGGILVLLVALTIVVVTLLLIKKDNVYQHEVLKGDIEDMVESGKSLEIEVTDLKNEEVIYTAKYYRSKLTINGEEIDFKTTEDVSADILNSGMDKYLQEVQYQKGNKFYSFNNIKIESSQNRMFYDKDSKNDLQGKSSGYYKISTDYGKSIVLKDKNILVRIWYLNKPR